MAGLGMAGPIGLAQAAGQPSSPVAWPGGNNYQRSLGQYTLPDVVLLDTDARPVRLRDALAGNEPVMLNFIFTTCSTVCPIMVRVFAELPSRLGPAASQLRLVSITIDPEFDTPAKLKGYAQNFAPNPRWQLLTGRAQDIVTVQRAFNSWRGDKMGHEPLTLIRHAPGQPWVRLDGFATPDELASEYRRPVLR
jgi:protein SCO1/2